MDGYGRYSNSLVPVEIKSFKTYRLLQPKNHEKMKW